MFMMTWFMSGFFHPKNVLVMNCFVLLADRGSLLGLFGRGMGIHVTERFGQLG